MKKKFFIALSVVVAAFAAAFAIGGCKFKDGSSSGINEYVVWNDGCGKTYTLRGGENVVAYYPCESDKILNFSYVYYNAATGEATREVAEHFDGYGLFGKRLFNQTGRNAKGRSGS